MVVRRRRACSSSSNSSLVVSEGETHRERSSKRARARARASKQAMLALPLSLSQEKIKEDTYTEASKLASRREGGREQERRDEKAKRFFRLLINRNHKKAQHATRVHSSLRPSVRLHPVFSYLLTHTQYIHFQKQGKTFYFVHSSIERNDGRLAEKRERVRESIRCSRYSPVCIQWKFSAFIRSFLSNSKKKNDNDD